MPEIHYDGDHSELQRLLPQDGTTYEVSTGVKTDKKKPAAPGDVKQPETGASERKKTSYVVVTRSGAGVEEAETKGMTRQEVIRALKKAQKSAEKKLFTGPEGAKVKDASVEQEMKDRGELIARLKKSTQHIGLKNMTGARFGTQVKQALKIWSIFVICLPSNSIRLTRFLNSKLVDRQSQDPQIKKWVGELREAANSSDPNVSFEKVYAKIKEEINNMQQGPENARVPLDQEVKDALLNKIQDHFKRNNNLFLRLCNQISSFYKVKLDPKEDTRLKGSSLLIATVKKGKFADIKCVIENKLYHTVDQNVIHAIERADLTGPQKKELFSLLFHHTDNPNGLTKIVEHLVDTKKMDMAKELIKGGLEYYKQGGAGGSHTAHYNRCQMLAARSGDITLFAEAFGLSKPGDPSEERKMIVSDFMANESKLDAFLTKYVKDPSKIAELKGLEGLEKASALASILKDIGVESKAIFDITNDPDKLKEFIKAHHGALEMIDKNGRNIMFYAVKGDNFEIANLVMHALYEVNKGQLSELAQLRNDIGGNLDPVDLNSLKDMAKAIQSRNARAVKGGMRFGEGGTTLFAGAAGHRFDNRGGYRSQRTHFRWNHALLSRAQSNHLNYNIKRLESLQAQYKTVEAQEGSSEKLEKIGVELIAVKSEIAFALGYAQDALSTETNPMAMKDKTFVKPKHMMSPKFANGMDRINGIDGNRPGSFSNTQSYYSKINSIYEFVDWDKYIPLGFLGKFAAALLSTAILNAVPGMSSIAQFFAVNTPFVAKVTASILATNALVKLHRRRMAGELGIDGSLSQMDAVLAGGGVAQKKVFSAADYSSLPPSKNPVQQMLKKAISLGDVETVKQLLGEPKLGHNSNLRVNVGGTDLVLKPGTERGLVMTDSVLKGLCRLEFETPAEKLAFLKEVANHCNSKELEALLGHLYRGPEAGSMKILKVPGDQVAFRGLLAAINGGGIRTVLSESQSSFCQRVEKKLQTESLTTKQKIKGVGKDGAPLTSKQELKRAFIRRDIDSIVELSKKDDLVVTQNLIKALRDVTFFPTDAARYNVLLNLAKKAPEASLDLLFNDLIQHGDADTVKQLIADLRADPKLSMQSMQSCVKAAALIGDLSLIKGLINEAKGKFPQFNLLRIHSTKGDPLLFLAGRSKKADVILYVADAMAKDSKEGPIVYERPRGGLTGLAARHIWGLSKYQTKSVEVGANIFNIKNDRGTDFYDLIGPDLAKQLDDACGIPFMSKGSFTLLTAMKESKFRSELTSEIVAVLPTKLLINFLINAHIEAIFGLIATAIGPGHSALVYIAQVVTEATVGLAVSVGGFASGILIGFFFGKGAQKAYEKLQGIERTATQLEKGGFVRDAVELGSFMASPMEGTSRTKMLGHITEALQSTIPKGKVPVLADICKPAQGTGFELPAREALQQSRAQLRDLGLSEQQLGQFESKLAARKPAERFIDANLPAENQAAAKEFFNELMDQGFSTRQALVFMRESLVHQGVDLGKLNVLIAEQTAPAAIDIEIGKVLQRQADQTSQVLSKLEALIPQDATPKQALAIIRHELETMGFSKERIRMYEDAIMPKIYGMAAENAKELAKQSKELEGEAKGVFIKNLRSTLPRAILEETRIINALRIAEKPETSLLEARKVLEAAFKQLDYKPSDEKAKASATVLGGVNEFAQNILQTFEALESGGQIV